MGRTPCCSKIGLNRGPWTPEEDDLLTKYIDVYGEGGWRTLPKKAGLLRCGKSCRLRWMNYLRPDVKRGQILPEEEDLILRLHRLLGNRWSLIAGRIPGRTDNEIKNYWNTHLSKKLISQGIDPRTHKPLSESEVPAASDSPGNSSKSAQKTLQPQTSDSQHIDLPPQNLAPAIASDSQEAASEKRPEISVTVRSPQLVSSVFNNFCAGEMNSKNAISSSAKPMDMGPAAMKSCHAFRDILAFNPLGALADSDKGIKQTQGSFSINNLSPMISCPDHHTPGVLVGVATDHDHHAPYLRTNSVTNNYYMAPSIITGTGLHCTSFFGHCLDPATSDLPSPLISGGAGNPFPTNGTWEQSVTMQHNVRSVNDVDPIRLGDANSSVHGSTYGNTLHSAAQTPANAAGHEDCHSDIFSSFLDSFINEELPNENNDPVASAYASQLMQQSSEPFAPRHASLFSVLISNCLVTTFFSHIVVLLLRAGDSSHQYRTPFDSVDANDGLFVMQYCFEEITENRSGGGRKRGDILHRKEFKSRILRILWAPAENILDIHGTQEECGATRTVRR